MKISLLLLSCIIVTCAYGQTPFEGIITYKVKGTDDANKQETELKVYFGKNAVRLKYREKEYFDKEEILARLDSGKSYTINTNSKTYSSRPLFKAKPAINRPEEKTIAGYKTKVTERMGFSISTVFGERFRTHELIAYTAPELYFPIPDSLRINPEFLMVHDNRIALRIEGNFSRMYGSGTDSFSLEAIEVIPMTVPSADFMIPPAGYTEEDAFSDGMLPDTLAAAADTTAVIELTDEPLNAPPPPPPAPARKKKTSGPPPARKPD